MWLVSKVSMLARLPIFYRCEETELFPTLANLRPNYFYSVECYTVACTYCRDFFLPYCLFNITNVLLQVTDLHPDGRDELSAKNSTVYAFPEEHFSSQKAISLPSSPHEYSSQASARSGVNDEMVSTWNKILESPMFQNKLLLPFHEWNIDFSEITVGSRVGIGEPSLYLSPSVLFNVNLLFYLYFWYPTWREK